MSCILSPISFDLMATLFPIFEIFKFGLGGVVLSL